MLKEKQSLIVRLRLNKIDLIAKPKKLLKFLYSVYPPSLIDLSAIVMKSVIYRLGKT